jgi:hypothetical protein
MGKGRQTSCLKSKFAWKADPDVFLQLEQWHITAFVGTPWSVYRIALQRQEPVKVGVGVDMVNAIVCLMAICMSS